jgi:hypothetical protein
MGEIKFGTSQLNTKTPGWANKVFYITTALIGVLIFAISGDPGIPAEKVVRIVLWLTALDKFILAISKLFGEQTPEITDIAATKKENNE